MSQRTPDRTAGTVPPGPAPTPVWRVVRSQLCATRHGRSLRSGLCDSVVLVGPGSLVWVWLWGARCRWAWEVCQG